MTLTPLMVQASSGSVIDGGGKWKGIDSGEAVNDEKKVT